MKYLFVLIAFISMQSLSAQVHKYRVFQSRITGYDNNGNKVGEHLSDTLNILLVVNYEKLTIETYGEKEAHYDLIRLNKDYYKDGDKWMEYEGVDDSGDKCNITFVTYGNPNPYYWIVSLIFEYKNVMIIDKLKPND